ncbi:hypothetical protein [Desulfosporosinus sp.]|nr:hypothetical protein [Desulfosporosinus sp.]MBC2724357.1 hypothetical protein [Desulfosporosinus sp.]MBC2727716.1 hypothetical protein [Desulfosporosinus sp.]
MLNIKLRVTKASGRWFRRAALSQKEPFAMKKDFTPTEAGTVAPPT